MLRVEDISEKNLDDVSMICSWNRPYAPNDDPVLEKARELKRQWLLEMLERYGSCTKIAYIDEKPVAHIIFYPEEAMPFLHNPRKDVVNIKCIYNSHPEARRKGAGAALLKALVDEGHSGLECLGGRHCRFVVTRPFPHDRSIDDFYEKYGFKHRWIDRPWWLQEMFLEIKGKYVPMKIPGPSTLLDRGRTIILYNVGCEWGYYFAKTAGDLIQLKHPHHPVEIFDIWKEPEEYKKLYGDRSIDEGWIPRIFEISVNAQYPENPDIFWHDREAFLRNVEKAMRQ